MRNKILKPLTETKYLSTENAWRYRGIMRCFYMNDQKFRHWMNKEQVFEQLTSMDEFSNYTKLKKRYNDLVLLGYDIEWYYKSLSNRPLNQRRLTQLQMVNSKELEPIKEALLINKKSGY